MPVLSKKLEAGLNQQINHELSAAYHYLAMQAWFENGIGQCHTHSVLGVQQTITRPGLGLDLALRAPQIFSRSDKHVVPSRCDRVPMRRSSVRFDRIVGLTSCRSAPPSPASACRRERWSLTFRITLNAQR